MKIGAKQITLFVVAALLIVVGFKHESLNALWKEPTASPTDDGVKDVFVSTGLPFDSKRLERDSARTKIKEQYQMITMDTHATDAAVTQAYDRIILLTQQAEQETKIEGLIREKGFSDAYVCFSDLGEIDVLIKSDALTEQQVTQVADIIARHTGLEYSAIHVRKVA